MKSLDRVRMDWVAREVRNTVGPEFMGSDTIFHYSIPVIDETGDGRLEPSEDLGSSKTVLVGGEVLISKLNPRKARVLIAERHDVPTVCSGEFVALQPRDVERRYLYWLLLSEPTRQELHSQVQSVTRSQQRARPDDISKMWIELPSREAQRAIADYLDAETAHIDQIVERLGQANVLLDEWLEAEIEAAIWSGEDAQIPLKHLTPGDRQIQYGIVLPGPDVPDGVPIVKGGNVVTGRIQVGELARTTHEIEAGFVRSRLRRNDIVFAIRGAVGACAIVPGEVEGANITQDVARVSPLSGVDPSWLLYALKSRTLQQQAEARIVGATIRGINIRDLKRVRVPLPTAEAQQRKAEALGQAQAHRDQVFARRERQIDLLVERRQALITAAVTGQLDIPGVAA